MNFIPLAITDPELKAMHQRVDEAIASAVKERGIQIDKLTQDQVCTVFKEACMSGDIEVQVRAADIGMGATHSQMVTYIPYREKQRLEARIAYLEDALKLIRDGTDCHGSWCCQQAEKALELVNP